MYQLLFYKSKALVKDRKKLIKNNKDLKLVEEALAKLLINPFENHLPVQKLIVPSEGTFRLRSGKWRIIFDIDTSNKKIIVYRIKQRKDGYV
jgi:mRNA-degrading endonuclease RelE of RelBE toxin-antitoxin system